MGVVEDASTRALQFSRDSALKRWQARTDRRREGLAKIAQQGIGGADSPEHQAANRKRELRRIALRFQEQIVGSNDLTRHLPSLAAAEAAKPVARLVRLPGANYDPLPIATGFLVSPSLLLTNHHVFPTPDAAREAFANFGFIQDERGIDKGRYFRLAPESLYFSDENLDFAMVAVEEKSLDGAPLGQFGFTRMIAATGKILTGMPVNIVQHPAGGPRSYAVVNNRLVDILPEGFLHYEADTLPGSSGSPLFNTDWELIGIHHTAIPRTRDGLVMTTDDLPFDRQTDTDSDIHWVANEGTRVSSMVKRVSDESFADPRQREIIRSFLITTTDPVGATSVTENTTSVGIPTASNEDSSMANNIFSFSGPVTINVLAPSQPKPPEPPKVDTQVAVRMQEVKQSFDPNYSARRGYDSEFLGVTLPLPSVDRSMLDDMYTVGDYRDHFKNDRRVPEMDLNGLGDEEVCVLPYHHFSLAVNKTHRMCIWTAANVDYSHQARQDPRPRREFGGEDWTFDPRVPRDLQLADPDIYKPGRRIDRGHIVRREDNCWGAAGDETAFANADTYHWTNCTPQHEAFNQERPRDNFTKDNSFYTGVVGIWGELESSLEKALKDGGEQAVVFAGPFLDERSVKPEQVGGVDVSIPYEYWKIVVIADSRSRDPNLLAYAYALSQRDAIKRFGLVIKEELGVSPKFDRMQVSISSIEQRTGIVFAQVLKDADQFSG